MSDTAKARVKPDRPLRPVQEGIPPTRAGREALADLCARYVAAQSLVPPLGIEELKLHVGRIIASAGLDGQYANYAAVLLSNEVWRARFAAVPHERRLLLLPQCLRAAGQCPAEIDELGLRCRRCGLCVIGELSELAEGLGCAVMVAEGAALVMGLIESGKIEAVVGVGCMSVLEQVFPYMEAGAVPGLAVPLLQDGCQDTSTDVDRLRDAIVLGCPDPQTRLDVDGLRRTVAGWFTAESLDELMGPARGQTEQIARQWLLRSGKRWRPFLAACAFEALASAGAPAGQGRDIRSLAVAVECFHKASLVHDDIEDADEFRYGLKTLHAEYGVPVALNVGDFLLGEGYRLIAQSGLSDGCKSQALLAASRGHRTLCIGQGAELCWVARPRPLEVAEVLEMFRQKTAPAFDVALHLGAIAAGADEATREILSRYSDCLGVAYQIRDDLADFYDADGRGGDVAALRPTILLAVACESLGPRAAEALESALAASDGDGARWRAMLGELRPAERAWRLLEQCKEQAISCLAPLRNAELKIILRRVLSRLFSVFEKMGCCDDHQAGNAPGG